MKAAYAYNNPWISFVYAVGRTVAGRREQHKESLQELIPKGDRF
jgi:hypothetical protein